MKSGLQKLQLVLAFVLCLSIKLSAQVTSHTVSIQPNYTNRTFYQMSSGIVSSVSNTDWDLGFQLRGFAASITINSKNNVHLYNANKSASDWTTMTASDTTGILSDPSFELYNSDLSWDLGAFSSTLDLNNPFDLGWGVYDFATHIVMGDSLYFIKLANGDIRKMGIESLAGGVYNFYSANLDGTNEVHHSLTKSTYQGKFFAYYSLVNNVAVDREPMYNAWDLSFEQYLTLTPFIYKVTGVLSNDSISVAQAYPVDTASTDYTGQTFSYDINNIGYDWKTYDFTNNIYIISDSTIYFMRDRAGNYWKVVFTGFGGSANGDFYFYQEPLVPTGLIENSSIKTLGLYPNPAHGSAKLMVDSKQAGTATLSVFDLSGRAVQNKNVNLTKNVQSLDLDLQNMIPGIYQVVIRSGNEQQVTRIVVQ